MKRLIPASVLLVLIITACICTKAVVGNICSKTRQLAETCESLCIEGNFEEAAEISKQLKNQWEKDSKIVMIFVNHELCDELSIFANRLHYHCLSGNTDFVFWNTSDIKSLLHQITVEQSLTALSFY